MSVAVSAAYPISLLEGIGVENNISPPSSNTSSLSGDSDNDRSRNQKETSSNKSIEKENTATATKKVKIELPDHRTVPKSIKSATLNIFGNNSSVNHHNSLFARSNLSRRSFTLPMPRGLFSKNSSGNSPVSENVNGNFVRNIFLTLTRRRKSKPKIKEESTPLNTINNETSTNNPGFAFPPGFTPGAIGLKNQGNSCYQNAIVQCLSHTDSLAKYLVTDEYKGDLKKKHMLFKNGKGEITEELAAILRCTWLRLNSSVLEDAATRFKSAVEKGATQWRGAEQHDAQEFFLWLLDRLHEDLNQGASNKYKPLKNNFGRPDGEVAREAWANHLRCNTSIIQDIFGAQFRSSLTCPGCSRQSATFDPFLCVSLPIPQGKQEVPIYVNVIYITQQPRQVKLGLSLSSSADIKELKQLISADTNIEENEILLYEIDGEGYHRTFTENQLVSVLSNNEAIYCVETPKVVEQNENDGAFLLITWTNLLVTSNSEFEENAMEDNKEEKSSKINTIRFGSVYISRIARETNFIDLQKILLKEMASILQPGILVSEQKTPVFSIRVLDGSSDGLSEGTLIDPDVEHPLYSESIDFALSLCDQDVQPHIKIHLEWKQKDKDRMILDDDEHVEEHSSCSETRTRHSSETASTVTLNECFELYTKAEELSAEDSWHCPHCNRKEEGTLKMIGLWSCPQVLVVHLKRFRQTVKGRGSVTKISSVVEFPIEFDLHPHISRKNIQQRVGGGMMTNGNGNNGSDSNLNLIQNVDTGLGINRSSNLTNGSNNTNTASSPMNGCFGLGGLNWKRASFKRKALIKDSQINSKLNGYNNPISTNEPDNFQYELFAVCNHHGKDLLGGHYTSFCKNPVDGTWWNFDDTKVTQLNSPEDVKTSQQAYILFYQRKPNNSIHQQQQQPGLTNQNIHWCRGLIKKHHKFPPLTTNGVDKPYTNGNGEHKSSSEETEDNREKMSKSNSSAPIVRMEDIDITSGTTAQELQIESTV